MMSWLMVDAVTCFDVPFSPLRKGLSAPLPTVHDADGG